MPESPSRTPAAFFPCDGEHHHGLILAMGRNFPDSVRYRTNRMVGARLWDKPQHLTEIQRFGAADCRLRFNRARTGAARESIRYARIGVTRSGKGDATYAEKILQRFASERSASASRSCCNRRAGNCGDEKSDRRTEIARMKRGARLINVARGSLLMKRR